MQPDASNLRKTARFARPSPVEPSQVPDGGQPAVTSLKDPGLYINRELSLLAFQWRVLQEVLDEHNPLLERFKFLSIVGANLEEFFMVRVAGLKRQIESGSVVSGADGLTPNEQLDAIHSEVATILSSAQECLHTTLLSELHNAGIHLVSYGDLDKHRKSKIDEFFFSNIFPVLTPLGLDPGHPFPHISNLSLNLAVLLRDTSQKERFARIKIPDTLPQLVPVECPESLHAAGQPAQCHVWLDDLIKANLESLFPGMAIVNAETFYVVRDAELEIQEWEAEDLLEITEEGIRQRRFGDVVQLQVHKGMPAEMLQILLTNMQIDLSDVYLIDTPRPLSSLKAIAAIDRPHLKYTPFVPAISPELNPDFSDEDMFAVMSRHDILLHHPYDSFQPVIHFLNLGVDPQVLASKITLYRVGKNSPVVEALLRAVLNRTQVAAVVELKARFDEESNIEWAKALESDGVHVVYGLVGLKIHAKVALIVRKEGDAIKRYVHLGTGNYNPVTAHIYSDIGLLTCDPDIGADVTDLFNYLTGYSSKRDYRKLVVAPINMRQSIQSWIRREIEHQQNGREGHIIIKLNSLVDEQVIELLYEASRAGVKVDLIIRGICCLRPGVPGVSENIRVTSILGRFLEHSRIYYFRNGGDSQIYCGSADLMPRNLDRRVEVLFPVENEHHASYLRNQVLETYLRDSRSSWTMHADGSYTKLTSEEQEQKMCSQDWFMSQTNANRDRQVFPGVVP